MRIKTQNALFQYFTDTLTEVIRRAKRSGRFDLGIVGTSTCQYNTIPWTWPLVIDSVDLFYRSCGWRDAGRHDVGGEYLSEATCHWHRDN